MNDNQSPKKPANRGSRFLTLAVYGVCAVIIFGVARFVCDNLPKKHDFPAAKAWKDVENGQFYPPGWEFLDPNNKNRLDFGKMDSEEAAAYVELALEEKWLEGEMKKDAEEDGGSAPPADAAKNQDETPESDEENTKITKIDSQGEKKSAAEPQRYVVAKIPNEVTKTTEDGQLRRRSPLLAIYGQDSAKEQKSEQKKRQAEKPISEEPLPPDFLEPPQLNTPEAEISPPVGKNANSLSETDEILRLLEEQGEKTPESLPASTIPGRTPAAGKPRTETPVPPYTANGPEVLRMFHLHAKKRLKEISSEIQDYYCILYKWDQTNFVTQERDVMHLLQRESPFSVYVRYEYPAKYRNREFIFWAGHYENSLLVNTGEMFSNRTMLIGLDSPAIRNSATRGVTGLGFRKLLEELVEISSKEKILRDAKVRYYENAHVGSRPCYALEVTFPEKRPELDFCRMEVMVDRELDLPVRVAMYDWGDTPEEPGQLLEEYIYIIKGINIGLEDIDFCYLNSHYKFREFVPRMSAREKEFQQAVLRNYQKMR